MFFFLLQNVKERKRKRERGKEEKNIIYNTIQRYIYNDRLLPRYLFNGKREIIRRHVFSRRVVIISTSGFQQRAPYKDDRKGGYREEASRSSLFHGGSQRNGRAVGAVEG